MRFFIAIILGILLTLSSNLIFPATALAVGIDNDRLETCPVSPNCVVSQNADKVHQIPAIEYHRDRSEAKEVLLKVLSVTPRTQIIEQTDNYIHAEAKSRIFGFIDDVEFYFPKDTKAIEVRSASRVGESDLGVNRRRLEQIRLALQDLQV
jgi:uncharacterized protein (DUF1499 family)